MRIVLYPLFTTAIASILWLLSVQGADGLDRIRLSQDHVDLRIQYQPGSTNELELMVRDRDRATNYATTNVVLVVREMAETPIPSGFEQFGEPGSPLWILPASQDPGLLFLGISGEGLPSGVFAEPPAIRLREVRGPGWFFLWQFDPSGGLNMILDSEKKPSELRQRLARAKMENAMKATPSSQIGCGNGGLRSFKTDHPLVQSLERPSQHSLRKTNLQQILGCFLPGNV